MLTSLTHASQLQQSTSGLLIIPRFVDLAMGAQGRGLYKFLAANVTLKVLFASVGHFVIFSRVGGGKFLFAIAAGIISCLLVDCADMFLKTR